jgi:hypothetical protein
MLQEMTRLFSDLLQVNQAQLQDESSFEEQEIVCPSPDPYTVCYMLYRPVLCNETCQYSNDCVAKSAGFDVTMDCVFNDGSIQLGKGGDE